MVLVLFAPAASANDRALAWLTAQFQPDGNSGRSGDVATAIQSTAETLRTLQVLDPASANASPASLTFLAASTQPPNTEYLARAVIANAEAKASNTGLLAALEANQNADGGFGGAPGFASNVLDTALAVEALAKAHSGNFAAISRAMGYLLNHQNLDGSYSLDGLTVGSPYPTAAALTALHAYRLDFNVVNPIAGAMHYLISAQMMSGGWGSDWGTALALLALAPATTDVTPFFLGIQALEAAQLSDGSWGQDVYSTALAARVLRAVRGSPTPSPWNASLTGRVVDSVSGLPLGGVQVTVGSALSATTDPAGTFRLNEVPPGRYFIAYAISGYADPNQTVSLTAGQQVDLGILRLTALPTTGIVTGIVTDSGNGQPIAGAQVTLTGADTAAAVSDAAGTYRFVALPGPVTITASAAGFLAATGSATLDAGQTLNFSPRLWPETSVPPTTTSVTGRVIDTLTGQPLAGASVSVAGNALQVSTDPTGLFQLADLPPGELALDVALAGYQSVHIALTAPAGMADLGTIRLSPLSSPDSGTTGVVTGIVTDSGSGQPIAGAQVTLTGAETVSVATDAAGAYRFVVLPGPVTVTVSAAGFLSATGSAPLQAGQLLNFSPGLLPETSAPPTTTSVTGTVVDALTGQPLAGVQVSIAGNALHVSTDATGLFRWADLPVGALELDLTLAGYQGLHVSLLASAGTADLGPLRLSPLPDSTTLTGIVTDNTTGAPLAGASVLIESLGKSALTGADGTYRIEGITSNTFTVAASAVGYLTRRGDVTMAQPSLMTLNVALTRASPADFDIAELTAEASSSSYPAHSEVEIEVQLTNHAATERQVRLYVVIVDSAGHSVEQFPAKTVPMGSDPAIALETVPAGGTKITEVEWGNGARAPGRYNIIIQAYDAVSGQLLAERSTPVELLETLAIGGSVVFDPPIAQLASQQPVHLTAQISNRGNLDLASGTVTAKITLRNPGYQIPKFETLAKDNGLNVPLGIDADTVGNVYVANQNSGTLSRVDSHGFVTEVASGFYMPRDVDVTSSGYIYVLNNYNRDFGGYTYERLAADGTDRQRFITNIQGQAIAALPDGRLLIAAGGYGVYEAAVTGQATRLPLTGLSNPADIQVNSQGVIYIADRSSTNGRILRLDRDSGNKLTLIQGNLPNIDAFNIGPTGELVVVYGGNRLALISADGAQRTEVPVTLPPSVVRGVVLDAEGRMVFSIYYSNTLTKLYPSVTVGDVVVGEMVYQKTVALPPLSLTGKPVQLDFGNWAPSVSGDFLVELSVDSYAEYGALYNTLHVGPATRGSIAVASPTIQPGDQANLATVTLFGADSTNLTRIDPNGISLAAELNTYGRGIAADTKGNIYASSSDSILRITKSGELETFVTFPGSYYGMPLAIDAQNNLYTSAAIGSTAGTILKITPEREITSFAKVNNNTSVFINGLAVGHDNLLYTVDSTNALSRIYPDGKVELLTRTGISQARGLAIDANGYFYIQTQISTIHQDADGIKRGYYKILRYSPDGKSYSEYYNHANFEFEGANIAADCSNNLLFTPQQDYPLMPAPAEENVLLQVTGDTGETRKVLYGPNIDSSLHDMDVLFYDRFGGRLLIWGHLVWPTADQRARGIVSKLFSFPVICGGIDADVHLVTRSDVDVSGMTPAPTQSIDRGDGTFEHIWALKDVDHRGMSLQLDLWLKGLTEGESRPIAQEAFVEFHNSFVPGQKVRTPLAVPTVLASSAMALQPSLDAAQYGPQAPVGITVAIENQGDQPFTGELRLSVVDAAGAPVQALPPIAVTEQPGHLTVPYPSTWSTGLFLAGGYQLQASLFDGDGRIVAQGSTAFTVVHDPAVPTLAATLSPDKLLYAGWDTVRLEGAVTNAAGNTLLDPTVMTVTVKAPNGAVLYTGTAEIGQLAPGGALPVGFGFALADAPSGLYTVEVRVTRALDGTRLDAFQNTFTVVHTTLQDLAGTLTATPTPVAAGTPVECRETVTNRSASSVEGLQLSSLLVSLDHETVLSEDHRTLNLAGGQTETRTRTVDTLALPSGDYACLLRATLNGAVRDVAAAPFKVVARPMVTLSGTVFHDANRDQARHGSEPGTAAGSVWVTAVADGAAVATAAVPPEGAYRLTVPGQATYTLVLSTIANGPAANLPFGWSHTGETQGGTPDSAGDGRLAVTVGLQDLADLDFGLDGLPALAGNDSALTSRTVPITLPVLANDHLGVGTTRFVAGTIDLDPATPEVDATMTVPGEGTFTVQPAGTVVFTPLPTFSGVSTVTYAVYDDLGQPANPANLTVTVAGPGSPTGDTAADLPRANPEAGITSLDTPMTFDVTVNDVAGPGATLTPATVDLDPATPAVDEDSLTPEGAWHSHGNGWVTFTPTGTYTGTVTQPYAITDSAARTAQSTLAVTVTGGDRPLALNDSGATRPRVPITLAVLDNDAASAGQHWVADTLDLDPDTPAVESSLDTAEGQWVVNAEGTITFTPADTGSGQPFTGTTALRPYAVTDSAGRTAAATLTVVVNPAQGPTAADDLATTPFNTPVTLAPAANDTAKLGTVLNPTTLDLDPGTATVEQVLTTPDGTWQVHPDGTLTFAPPAEAVGPLPALTYLIRDSLGHAATAHLRVTVAPPESVTLRGTVFHDLDHNQVQNGAESGTTAGGLHVTAVNADDQAVATAPVQADGRYQLAVPPLADYHLILATAADSRVASLPADWSTSGENRAGTPDATADGRLSLRVGVVTVEGLNFGIDGAPSLAYDDHAITPYATPVTVAPLANDRPGPGTTRLDPATLDLDPATPAIDAHVTVADQGIYTAASDGTVTFTPEPAFSGVSTLAYRVQDDLGQFTAVATLTVAVGPSATDDTLTTPYETPANGSLAGNDHAPDDAVFARTGGPSHGTVVIAEDGRYIYTPAAGYSGPDSFAYQVCLPPPDDTLCASATATVTVTAPPIDLRGQLEPGPRGRLLVLVDPLAAGCAGDMGEADAACAAARAERAYLDAVLKTGGWTHTLVDTASGFTRELHSGAYRLYAVLSARVKLAEQVQKELREAVYHGAGLLVGGDHDQRNNVLDEALGLRYVGQSPATVGLQLPTAPGYVGVDRTLASVDRILRVRPLSATVLGQFVDLDRKMAGPAVTHQGYGYGEAAYLAFDLLAEGAATEPAGAGEASQLLLNLLDDLAPAPEYRPGDVMPIRLSLHNAGIAVEGWIDLALGGGATVYDAGGAVLQADGRLRWDYALAVNGTLERLAWTRLPATGTATADARIFVAGRAAPYATLALAWPVAEMPALETAQRRLEALVAADKAYQSARQSAQRAAQALAAGNLDQARAELARTAEALIRIGTAEAAEVRQAVDEALRRVGLPG
jgi:CshA-type fibril repeat protein